jgi:multidrug efflux system membrane fusion protein
MQTEIKVMRKIPMMIGLLCGAAAATLIAIYAVEGAGRDKKPPAVPAQPIEYRVPVPVKVAVRKTVPIFLDYVGTTEAIRTVTLQAKVTGYVARQAVADGADVKPGDLLYVLDQRDYQAALEQNKAQSARDAAALDYARSRQGRQLVLNNQGWAAKDTYEQATSSMDQAAAAVQVDRALIQVAELNLGYTEIRAPFEGRLGRSQVHEGALVTVAGTSFNTLVQLDPIYTTFNPSEMDLGRISAAAARGAVEAEILLSGDARPSLRGKLSFLDNNVDRTTGTITARVTVDNPRRTVLPGQYVRVRLHVAELDGALLVPQTAIGSNQIGKFVYVVGPDDKAEQRYVSLGPTDGDLVVVTKGVNERDLVIIGNLQRVAPGTAVRASTESRP